MDTVGHPTGRRGSRGFTLIELLIVIVIIGILATLSAQGWNKYRDRAREAAIKSDLRNAMASEEAYFADNLTYAAFSVGPGGTNVDPDFSASAQVSITVTLVAGGGVMIVGTHAATTSTWCMSTTVGLIVEAGSC